MRRIPWVRLTRNLGSLFVLRERLLTLQLQSVGQALCSAILERSCWYCMPFASITSNVCFHSSEPIARSNGCAVVRTYTGHGINDLFHGSPNYIPHYAKNKAVGTMRPGMVSFFTCAVTECMPKPSTQCFTIEPVRCPPISVNFELLRIFSSPKMLNLGHNWGDVHWPDNWTATTVDGKRSAQFEDTLLYVSNALQVSVYEWISLIISITETGVEILTRHERPIA